MGETTGQDHAAVATDCQSAHVREQPVLPGNLRIQLARGAQTADFDPDHHSKCGGPDQKRAIRQKAKMSQRLDRLQSPGWPSEPIEEVHCTDTAADGQVAAMRVDREERCLAGSGTLDFHLEISTQKDQAAVVSLAEQGDQRAFIADRPGRDVLGNPRERERFSLCTQQIKLVPLIPGEDPSGLGASAKPFRGASVTIVQATSGSSRVDVRGVISAIASLAFVRFVPPVPGYSFLIVSSAVEKGKAGMLVIRRPFHRFLASSSCQFL